MKTTKDKKDKKILKRILIIMGIIIGVLALSWGVMFLKLKSELSGFAPLESGKVVNDIFVVKDDFANLFIIQDSAQYIVIDCATDPVIVEEQMKKLGITPADVSAVFLTHTDGDYVGALGLFDKAKLYMSKEEEQMINGKKSKFLWFGNSISRTDYTLLEDREIAPIPAFFNMDNAQAIESMDIIRHIPGVEYIFTAHWGYL